MPRRFFVFLERVGGIAQKVVDLFDVSFIAVRPTMVPGPGAIGFAASRTADRDCSHLEAITPLSQTKDLPARGVAQPYSGIDHGLQNRLQVDFSID